MRIYVNPVCNYGQGRRTWDMVVPELRRRFGAFDAEEIMAPENLEGRVRVTLAAGERVFIAAGGDGTVNLLLNALLSSGVTGQDVVLGAVGLGSSNDFHKPFRPDRFVAGVPIRMDWENPVSCDVIAVRYQNGGDGLSSRHCLINASVGITAEANALYNSRARSVALFKRMSHEAAVVVSALQTIARYRNIDAALSFENRTARAYDITNLGVIKNPHFAGGLCYDQAVRPDDGQIGINLCVGMTKWEAIKTLLRLYKKDFSGHPKTYTWFAREFALRSEKAFALEMDGEVVKTDRAIFSVYPGLMRCCA
ncbi:MAG: diacylglycerol kinase family protein [Candidatus Aminicenantales bacterium]